MIVKPNELTFGDKRFFCIIAGVPGIGKTTLALSAPKPLLLDLDGGIGRVEARYRKDADVAQTFEELSHDLATADLSAYESIVIDTGGKLLEMLKPVAIAEDQANGKRDGSLSLKGYGAVKRKFAQFVQTIRSLKKHLIIVFHASEVALANDLTGLRIRVEGSTRDDVWDDVDIGGFMEMAGKKRTIGFSNCERYYAKGTMGVHGIYEIPTLANGSQNDFLTRLFKQMQDGLNAETRELKAYQETMDACDALLAEAKDAETLNNVYGAIAQAEHHLTSKEELWAAVNAKAKAMGLKYDKPSNKFLPDNA